MAVVGFGRIGEDGSVDGQLFSVSVGVSSPETRSVSCKWGPKQGIPLYGSSFGVPGGGSLSGGPEGCEGRVWRWASLFMGAQLVKLEWARLLGTL